MNTRNLFLALVAFGCLQTLAAAERWQSLFDGKSLDGWEANENPSSWIVEDGALVAVGERSHLFYTGDVANHDFNNFELEAEVMTKPGANSGIYIHTKFQDEGWPAAGYECQVANSNPQEGGDYIEHKMTGSIYAVRNTWQSPARDNEWFKYRIRVVGNNIQTFIDGKLICEYTEPAEAWRPDDKKGRLLGSGTFALQAHDPGSVVRYRDIRVRLLPDDEESSATSLEDRELAQLITRFSNDNVPLIDIGISPSSRGFSKSQLANARQYGLTFVDTDVIEMPASLLIVNDRNKTPNIKSLKAAKFGGTKIVFSSGGAEGIDEERLKARLQAIAEAGLEWSDFWVPGK